MSPKRTDPMIAFRVDADVLELIDEWRGPLSRSAFAYQGTRFLIDYLSGHPADAATARAGDTPGEDDTQDESLVTTPGRSAEASSRGAAPPPSVCSHPPATLREGGTLCGICGARIG